MFHFNNGLVSEIIVRRYIFIRKLSRLLRNISGMSQYCNQKFRQFVNKIFISSNTNFQIKHNIIEFPLEGLWCYLKQTLLYSTDNCRIVQFLCTCTLYVRKLELYPFIKITQSKFRFLFKLQEHSWRGAFLYLPQLGRHAAFHILSMFHTWY